MTPSKFLSDAFLPLSLSLTFCVLKLWILQSGSCLAFDRCSLGTREAPVLLRLQFVLGFLVELVAAWDCFELSEQVSERARAEGFQFIYCSCTEDFLLLWSCGGAIE